MNIHCIIIISIVIPISVVVLTFFLNKIYNNGNR